MRAVIEVKRIDLWSLFKVGFLVYAAIGLIGGLFYAAILFVAGGLGEFLFEEEASGIGFFGGALGVVLVPVLGFVYGAIGSVVIVIVGALFNLAVRVGGGLRFDIDTPSSPGGGPQTESGAPVAQLDRASDYGSEG